MKRWHLYLDESGTFNAQKDDETPEHNLVGGFLLPEKDGELLDTHKPLVAKWVDDVVTGARSAFPEAVDYDFLHCSENKGKWAHRKSIQPYLVSQYRERILAMQGRIVIFDGGRALADVNNTSTFLSVLSKGVIRLYHTLEKETPDNKVELMLHCARRRPHGEENPKPIPKEAYQQEMKHIAFLLCEFPGKSDGENPFYRTVDNMEIIPPENRQQNPLTVVCDCLCNTYQNVKLYGTRDSGWEDVYRKTYRTCYTTPENKQMRLCMTFDTTQSERIEEGELNRMERERTYVPMLIRILNRHNPEKELVDSYFDRLNHAPEFMQRMFVTELIERLNVETQSYYRDVYADVVRQIERIIELLEENMTNQALLTEMCANAHLFLLTMHTHRGQDQEVQQDMEAFQQALARMQDYTAAVHLHALYDNRLLVFQTDRFEFQKVDEGFSRLRKYWEGIFAAYSPFPLAQAFTSSEHGKEIGSYLQMLRFRLRHSKLGQGGDFDALRSLARDCWQEGCRHLAGGDLSRLHQTMCDVEAEIGDHEAAFRHLYAAAILQHSDGRSVECHEPFGRTEMDVILGAAWTNQMEHPFIYYHFVRLMNELALIRDERAKQMLVCLPANCTPATYQTTQAHDMRIGIKWKLGSTLVRVGENDKGSWFLGDALQDALSLNERAFDAIALAIACERVAVGVGSNRDVPGIYAGFLEKTRAVGAVDPFAEVLSTEGVPDVKTCALAARMIAY